MAGGYDRWAGNESIGDAGITEWTIRVNYYLFSHEVPADRVPGHGADSMARESRIMPLIEYDHPDSPAAARTPG